MPLIMGPSVCPISIVVLRKPMDVPIRLVGVSSHIRGVVDDMTRAKPMPYPMERARSMGNCVVKGIRKRSIALMVQPKIIGKRLPYLSDNRPSMGLRVIRDMICVPIIMDTAMAFMFAISIMYWTR